MTAGQIIVMQAWPPLLQMLHLEQMGIDERFVREYGSDEYHGWYKKGSVEVPPIPMVLLHGENTKRFPQAALLAWLEEWFSAGVVRERKAATARRQPRPTEGKPRPTGVKREEAA